jgi:hypothetical protein
VKILNFNSLAQVYVNVNINKFPQSGLPCGLRRQTKRIEGMAGTEGSKGEGKKGREVLGREWKKQKVLKQSLPDFTGTNV